MKRPVAQLSQRGRMVMVCGVAVAAVVAGVGMAQAADVDGEDDYTVTTNEAPETVAEFESLLDDGINSDDVYTGADNTDPSWADSYVPQRGDE